MPQRCPMAFIYISRAIYFAGLIYFLLTGRTVMGLFWLVWLPMIAGESGHDLSPVPQAWRLGADDSQASRSQGTGSRSA